MAARFSLLRALDHYRVPPGSNVWADVATVWRSLLSDPVQAAHVLGKLLSQLGQDRMLWGTDSVWYGPPQTQTLPSARSPSSRNSSTGTVTRR